MIRPIEKYKNAGIKQKFLIPIIFLSATGFLTLLLLSYISFHREVTKDIKELTEEKAQKIQSVVNGKIEKWKSEVRLLADSKEASDTSKLKVAEFLKIKKTLLKDYLLLVVADKKGDFYTTDGIKGNNFKREYFQRAIKGELIVSDPLISITTGRPMIAVAAPRKNINGEIIGVLSGVIDLAEITNIINSEKIDSTGYALMVDRKGVVMAYPEKDLILKFSLLNLKNKETQTIVHEMLDGRKLNHPTTEYYTFHGQKKLISFLPAGTNGWSIGVTVPRDEAFSSVIKLNYELILTALIVTFIICVIILKFIKGHILAPILKLERAAHIISEGDLKHTIDVNSNDELGKLSEAFNKMTRNLYNDNILRKKMEDVLKERENLLELFFSQSLDGFYIMKLDEPIDWEGCQDKEKMIDYVLHHEKIIKANDAILMQYGARREEFLGLTPYELCGHNVMEAKNGWTYLLDHKRSHVETDERRFDGTQMWVEGDYICIYDDKGRNIGHFGIQRDITERKLIQEDLIKAKEKAELSNKLKTEFLAQMSHEIRTPVNTILSFNSLLSMELEDKLPEELKDSFKIINLGGRRLIRTIDLILNMSEIQTGSYESIISEFDLDKDIICSLLPEFRMNAQAKNLGLKYENRSQNSVIRADNYTVMQICVNLIDNAIKFTQQGQVAIVLENSSSSEVTIRISDSGIGISKEYLPYLFEPFSQEDSGYTRKFEGNGLGLALTKKYCELNNAEISVQSAKGIGTVFSVTFML